MIKNLNKVYLLVGGILYFIVFLILAHNLDKLNGLILSMKYSTVLFILTILTGGYLRKEKEIEKTIECIKSSIAFVIVNMFFYNIYIEIIFITI